MSEPIHLPGEAAAQTLLVQHPTELQPRELAALRHFCASDQAPLAVETQEGLLRLYLRGKTTESIRTIFPRYTLGQIVQARVVGRWDEAVEEMWRQVRARAVGAELDVVAQTKEFTADLLMATVQFLHPRIQRFIATGDVSELEGVRVEKVGDLKRILDIYAVTHQAPGAPRGSTVQPQEVSTAPAGPVLDPAGLGAAQAQLLAKLSGEAHEHE